METLRILILGATGAAGSSLLEVSLSDPRIGEIRTLSRRPIETPSSRHKNVIHQDLLDYRPVSDAFANLDACYFCIGRAVSQVKGETEYRSLAFSAPVAAAQMLATMSPRATFHYLSGQGANLKSRQLWARVKAEAEERLINGFGANGWRPGVIDSKVTRGWPFFYRVMVPPVRLLAPSRRFYTTGADLGGAMLQLTLSGDRSNIIENPRIRALADLYYGRKQP